MGKKYPYGLNFPDIPGVKSEQMPESGQNYLGMVFAYRKRIQKNSGG